MSRKFAYLLLVLAVLAAVGLTFAAGVVVGHVTGPSTRVIPSIQQPTGDLLVQKARDLIKDGFVNKVSDAQLNNGAIEGMMKALGDPYTEYIAPKEYGLFQEHAMGEFQGIGVTLGTRNKKITVIHPLPGTPALKAGIKAGDVIVAIDGTSTAKMSLPTASDKIRGPKGTKVKLDVLRGTKKLKFTITRAAINIPTVQTSSVGKGIGYVAIRSFTPSTAQDFEKEIKKLDAKKAKGVIVDLRFNPGGLVESSVDIASIFIDKGTIVGMRRQDNVLETMSAVQGYHTKMKLVVLVNGDSASASEIVAGAIQDDKRGVIVGTKTYGKASVQTIENLPNGGALKLTTAHYFTPKGRLIQKIGIKPDVVVKMSTVMKPGAKDVQKEKAIQVLRELVAGTRQP